MSNNTQQLIQKYFNSLVQEFITDPKHKDITIIFTDYIEKDASGDTLGTTYHERVGGDEHWKEINGVEVPGSRWKEPYKYTYTVTFLNHYKNEERWRGTVAHEFTHLYLYTKSDVKHEHDDGFYSHMEKFENWIDSKWSLTPRQDKSGDWTQHVDPNKHEERKKKECTSCGKREIPYNTAGECFQCHEKGKEHNQKHNEQHEETGEFNRLTKLLDNSKTLTELENNWQIIKNSPLYDSNKRTTRLFKNAHELPDEDNKTRLDKWYNNCKSHFQPQDFQDPKCTECQKSIRGNSYHSKSNQALCKECYDNRERERERERERAKLNNFARELLSYSCPRARIAREKEGISKIKKAVAR